MRLKPDAVSVGAWRDIIGNNTMEDSVYLILRAVGDPPVNRDEVEVLVRDARGGVGNDDVGTQQYEQQQQQQAAPVEEIQQNSSWDVTAGNSTLATPHTMAIRETQQQGSFWERHLSCLFPCLFPRPTSRPEVVHVPVNQNDNEPAAGPHGEDDAPDNRPRLDLMEGLVQVHGHSRASISTDELRGNVSVSTAGLPLSEDTRRNPQDMSQSDPGKRIGLYGGGN